MVILISLLAAYAMLAAIAVVFVIVKHRFDKRRDSIGQRILVTGSEEFAAGATISAVLREAGVRTFGRTSAPNRLTLPNGQEALIERPGILHILDWSRLLRSFAARRADAVVYSRSGVGYGLRSRLELAFFRPTLVIIAGKADKWAHSLPAGATVIKQSSAKSLRKVIAARLGIRLPAAQAVPEPPKHTATTVAEPLAIYTTRTRVRQRLHGIIDKLDAAHLGRDHPDAATIRR